MGSSASRNASASSSSSTPNISPSPSLSPVPKKQKEKANEKVKFSDSSAAVLVTEYEWVSVAKVSPNCEISARLQSCISRRAELSNGDFGDRRSAEISFRFGETEVLSGLIINGEDEGTEKEPQIISVKFENIYYRFAAYPKQEAQDTMCLWLYETQEIEK